MKKSKKLMVGVAGISLLLTSGLYGVGCAYFSMHFMPGTYINGMDCSFLSIDDTVRLFERKVQSYALAVHTRNNGVEKISAEDVGMKFDSAGDIDQAINNQDYLSWPLLREERIELGNMYSVNCDKLSDVISGLECMSNMQAPVSARIIDYNKKYQVINAIQGTQLDRDKVTAAIETALWLGNMEVDLENCYINPVQNIDVKELEVRCKALNQIRDTIITYDFGDRKETVDINLITEKMLTDYVLDKEKVTEYVKTLAVRYNTQGIERTFVTFDDRKIKILGGDYGWLMDTEKESEWLYRAILDGMVDIRIPLYAKEAFDRCENDIGLTYIEINTKQNVFVFYNDGKPIVQTDVLFGEHPQNGIYSLKKPMETYGEKSYWLPIDDNIGIYSLGSQEIENVLIPEGNFVIPRDSAAQVFQLISTGTPIVIY